MSSINTLPIIQAIKVTNKSFVAGHPSQIVDLLTAGVATAVIKSKPNSTVPMYECLLRCPLLAPNANLPIYFCLDHLNQPLLLGDQSVSLQLPSEDAADLAGIVDVERATFWSSSMVLALSFWEIKMEEAVLALYPNRTPKQVDAYTSGGLIQMKVWPSLADVNVLLDTCARRGGFPSFKLSYTWIGSKEDPRSKEHIWGMKFDFSSYGTFPVVPRTRKPVSAMERQEQLLKKRKAIADEAAPMEELKEEA